MQKLVNPEVVSLTHLNGIIVVFAFGNPLSHISGQKVYFSVICCEGSSASRGIWRITMRQWLRPDRLIDEATESDVLGGGPPDAELIASYRAGQAALLSTLRSPAPDVACATFLPAKSPLAFWVRRQAHETAIHRYDAQSAGSNGPPDPVAAFAAEFAADGIDELIMGFTPRMRRLRGASWSLAVHPADDQGRWHVRPGPGKTEVSSTDAAADCVLSGPASGLYAFLWNRCTAQDAGIAVTGDASVLAIWNSSARVRWS